MAEADFTLRVVEPADRPALADLRHGWRGGHVARHRRWVERTVREADGERGVFYVACDPSGVLVGYARCTRFEPPEDAAADCAPAGWYLVGMFVAPAWRRAGVARALTVARMRWLRDRDARDVRIFARADNAPIMRLMEGFDFVEETRAFSYPGVKFGPAGGVLMVRRGAC